MKLRSGRICLNMECNPISFRDTADKLFRFFNVGETLMSSHENSDRVKTLTGETNVVYDTFDSFVDNRITLICQVIYLAT